jgi:2,3-bisphosphoglycerate-independent phosphoglycerate mutase
MINHNSRKYLILVGDGMADYPLKELDGKTPLETAGTPNMDRIASCHIGLVRTIPAGMGPGSDVANLSLLGYDPSLYLTGRSPLEAASMGVSLKQNQVAFRMNLVTLEHRSEDRIIMISHSSGDISTPESAQIVKDLKKGLKIPGIDIYPGVAYRHLLVWENGPEDAATIPPHDVLDQDMSGYLNRDSIDPVPSMIRKSWPLLKDHPVNLKRRQAGLNEANSIWLWGQGKAPAIPLFKDLYGLDGGAISAVDLIKGIGIYAGFRPIYVEGATGYLDTNYRGKAEAALKEIEYLDLVFLHVEAPDEASHNGSCDEKIQAIESFDRDVVGVVLEGMTKYDDYRVMVVSDHFTPIVKKTHTNDPAPFAWADGNALKVTRKKNVFTENSAKESGLFFESGPELMKAFLQS